MSNTLRRLRRETTTCHPRLSAQSEAEGSEYEGSPFPGHSPSSSLLRHELLPWRGESGRLQVWAIVVFRYSVITSEAKQPRESWGWTRREQSAPLRADFRFAKRAALRSAASPYRDRGESAKTGALRTRRSEARPYRIPLCCYRPTPTASLFLKFAVKYLRHLVESAGKPLLHPQSPRFHE